MALDRQGGPAGGNRIATAGELPGQRAGAAAAAVDHLPPAFAKRSGLDEVAVGLVAVFAHPPALTSPPDQPHHVRSVPAPPNFHQLRDTAWRDTFKKNRSVALAEWRQLAA
jgi:hypothetical protein